jgi:hypothetical protein
MGKPLRSAFSLTKIGKARSFPFEAYLDANSWIKLADG